MMNKKSLLAVLGCVAMLGLVGCSDDDATCGNGIVEGGEQCDGAELDGQTCADVVAGSTGNLSCNADCTFNTTQCSSIVCGDGHRDFGEACDCGTDAGALPAGCPDVNGGADANCDANCQAIDLCGDGVITGNEECDCGDDTIVSDLPSGCTNWNGETDSECYADCTENPTATCSADFFDECDPLVANDCCPDDWDGSLSCQSYGDTNRCFRDCATTPDCYWNSFCLAPMGYGDYCWFADCGPGADIEADINGTCEVPGGGTGWCWPIFYRTVSDEQAGICIESGTLAVGSTCSLEHGWDSMDRSEDMCENGVCLGAQGALQGECAQFCDPNEAYDAAILGTGTERMPCPTDTNCFCESTIEEDPTADNYGARSGDLAYCMATETADPTNGYNTCSIVTQQLLSNPSQTCADTNTDGVCVMISFSGGGTTYGTPIGVCIDGSGATTKNMWEACTAGTDICEPGSVCMEEDIFSTAAGTTRCVPYCDTTVDGQPECEALGAVPTGSATPTCTTMSNLFDPADISPTRLGLCAY